MPLIEAMIIAAVGFSAGIVLGAFLVAMARDWHEN